MQSISELRQICQSSKHVKENDTKYTALVARKFSIYFTWLLLHTPISANQTTFLFIILGILASLCFLPSDYLLSLLGVFLLQIWFIFDCVDGEIARYRDTSSVTGSYFDLMAHDIVNSFLFICLSYGVYSKAGEPLVFAFGFSIVASLFLTKLSWLSKIRTLLVEGRHSDNKDALTEPVISLNMVSSGVDNNSSGIQKIYSRISFLFRFPGIMNVLCVAAIIDKIEYFIFAYGALLPWIWVAQVYKSVTKGIVIKDSGAGNKQ